jgi:hypothetical protein
MRCFVLLIAAVVHACAADSQPADPQLLNGYRDMYNLRFDEARQAFSRYSSSHVSDPLGPVSTAAAWLFGEFERLKILQSEFFTHNDTFLSFRRPPADASVKRNFEDAMNKARELSGVRLHEAPSDPDALLADTIRLGLAANFASLIEKKNLDALKLVKESRAIAARLLGAHPEYSDAHLAAGVENYLLSQHAAPIRWILHAGGAQTDFDTGIEELKITAEKGHYLQPYARLLLAVADLRANDKAGARRWLEVLSKEFPGNPLYRLELERLK